MRCAALGTSYGGFLQKAAAFWLRRQICKYDKSMLKTARNTG